MGECTGKYFIENGVLKASESFNVSMIYQGELVYDVLRVIEGIPLFFEDHIERLDESLALSKHRPLAAKGDLIDHIRLLVRENGIENGNVKIIYHFNGAINLYMVYFIEARYPDDQMYKTGVDTILFDAERKTPAAKIFNFRLRSSISDALVRKSAYEALLVNTDNCITEGSRSNVFFIMGNHLITADDKYVLGGITRKYVKQLCYEKNIPVVFRCLPASELHHVDAVFLSGTSPQILPVRSVGEYLFSVDHPVLGILLDEYSEKVRSYVTLHR